MWKNYVKIDDDKSLDFGTGDFSIAAWVYSKGYYSQVLDDGWNALLSKGDLTADPSGFYGFFIQSNNQVYFGCFEGVLNSAETLKVDGWKAIEWPYMLRDKKGGDKEKWRASF